MAIQINKLNSANIHAVSTSTTSKYIVEANLDINGDGGVMNFSGNVSRVGEYGQQAAYFSGNDEKNLSVNYYDTTKDERCEILDEISSFLSDAKDHFQQSPMTL